MFNFPKCRHCNATLPIATGICPHCTQLSPAPAQQSQSESIAAPAEVGQGLGTITCAACGSTNTEPCCHPAEFCQAICNDCNKPLNADGSVWVEKQEPKLPVEVPDSDTLWMYLTKGYSLHYVRSGLMSGEPRFQQEAKLLRERAQVAWAKIRAEVGA